MVQRELANDNSTFVKFKVNAGVSNQENEDTSEMLDAGTAASSKMMDRDDPSSWGLEECKKAEQGTRIH